MNRISIIGLGYVGLPLAVEFAKKYLVIGYDINKNRVNQLNKYKDNTNEVDKNLLKKVSISSITEEKGFFATDNHKLMAGSDFFIITVPTPIDKNKRPDLRPLISASNLVGSLLKAGNIIIYESTVYPGVTEEICAPILEEYSKLKLNKDFFLGYSPERINPGDKLRTVSNILKITSGSCDFAAEKIDNLYKSVIKAGTFLAPTIKVAEAAKVIENAQRDINIAFVNELSKIFNLLEIDTTSVLEAASTKWNFLNFKPGLVGGHCIGVDPYYLAQKAQEVGYHPEIILSGRRLNDSMGFFVSNQVIKLMVKNDIKIKDSNILILGITFKENCPDIRNTKVIDIIFSLKEFGINVDVYDPTVKSEVVEKEFGFKLIEEVKKNKYNAIILAVAHDTFLNMNLNEFKGKDCVVYDVKGVLGKNSDGKL